MTIIGWVIATAFGTVFLAAIWLTIDTWRHARRARRVNTTVNELDKR